ncbi:MAG: Glycosyltransferase AglJ [Methanomassiliicoccales archaeon PtaU1.Bin124]|nr:MAG: Glycosyltransferase AglJ [Methanomassiliicoccales archaeon PtaU1.Bin124]
MECWRPTLLNQNGLLNVMPGESGRVIALIPAYNEELTIASVVHLAAPYVYKVIVVNDGSKDRTSLLAKIAGAVVYDLEKNSGKAHALMEGFKECMRYDPDCVVMLDGDGQMDPGEIPAISAPVLEGKADLVIGSRYIRDDAEIPRTRRLGLKTINFAQKMGSDVSITDSQSGYRALSRSALKNLDFDSKDYNIETDMIMHFSRKGLKIVEVPFNVRYDVPNGHKENPWKHGMSVLGRIVGFVGYKRPLLLFGVPGFFILSAGTILGLFTLFETTIIFQWTLTLQGIAGIAMFGVGLFLIFVALILNSLRILMSHEK